MNITRNGTANLNLTGLDLISIKRVVTAHGVDCHGSRCRGIHSKCLGKGSVLHVAVNVMAGYRGVNGTIGQQIRRVHINNVVIVRIDNRGIRLTIHHQRHAFARVYITRNCPAHRDRRLQCFLSIQYVIGGDFINRHTRIGLEVDIDMAVCRIRPWIASRIAGGYRRDNVRVATQVVDTDILRPDPLTVIRMHHGS